MWLVEGFCEGAIRHSARLFGTSGRNSGQTPTSLDLQSAYTFLNCSFPYRPALIRGVQSGAAQHRHATDVLCRGDFTISGMVRFSHSILFAPSSRTRLMANRWAAVAWEQVFVWVRFAVLRACSARRAVLLGEPPRA